MWQISEFIWNKIKYKRKLSQKCIYYKNIIKLLFRIKNQHNCKHPMTITPYFNPGTNQGQLFIYKGQCWLR